MRAVLLAIVGLAASACLIEFPDTAVEGRYRCIKKSDCLTGFECLEGLCQRPPHVDGFADGDSFQGADPFNPGDSFEPSDPFNLGDSFEPSDPFSPGDSFEPGDSAVTGDSNVAAGDPHRLTGLDSTFGTDGVVTVNILDYDNSVGGVVIQQDQKIVVAATYGVTANLMMLRYNSDGTADDTFGDAGRAVDPFDNDTAARAVTLTPKGAILAASRLYSNAADGYVIALTQFLALDGGPDTSFHDDGWLIHDPLTASEWPSDIALSDTNILVAAKVDTAGIIGVSRFTANGTLDTDFAVDGLFAHPNTSNGGVLAIQGDGGILVGTTLSGSTMALLRLLPDGSLDNNFDTDGVVTGGTGITRGIALQPNGKVLIVGENAGAIAVVRFTSTGALDTSFDTDGRVEVDPSGAFDRGSDIALLPDDRIAIAGSDGDAGFAVIILESNGQPDATFASGGIFTHDFGADSAAADAIAVQADGRLVVAGRTLFVATAKMKIIRILP